MNIQHEIIDDELMVWLDDEQHSFEIGEFWGYIKKSDLNHAYSWNQIPGTSEINDKSWEMDLDQYLTLPYELINKDVILFLKFKKII